MKLEDGKYYMFRGVKCLYQATSNAMFWDNGEETLYFFVNESIINEFTPLDDEREN